VDGWMDGCRTHEACSIPLTTALDAQPVVVTRQLVHSLLCPLAAADEIQVGRTSLGLLVRDGLACHWPKQVGGDDTAC
jgi:hypothetical protein